MSFSSNHIHLHQKCLPFNRLSYIHTWVRLWVLNQPAGDGDDRDRGETGEERRGEKSHLLGCPHLFLKVQPPPKPWNRRSIHRSSLDLISNFSIDSDFASSGTHQLRFWSTTVGRDKTYRTIQYIARFLAWYEYRKGATKETVARLTALKSSLGLSRKREWSDLIWSRGEDW